MKKTEIPRHIDFIPRKDIAYQYERSLDGRKVFGNDLSESNQCPKCGGEKHLGMKYCFKCLPEK
ncbi:MAG TPA: hypothetical protein ENH85_01200 [Candidatus Scalindua sp.]|nr:hypothetical protein [Candidatus Scalindua sp.]